METLNIKAKAQQKYAIESIVLHIHKDANIKEFPSISLQYINRRTGCAARPYILNNSLPTVESSTKMGKVTIMREILIFQSVERFYENDGDAR